MKKAVIFHGMPEESEYQANESQKHWIPWLKHQLESSGYEVFAPELPKAYEPNYEDWLAVLKQFPVDEETVLIGHSCGGGFFIRYLSEHECKVGKVIFVAPWIDPKNHLKSNFFVFGWDPDIMKKTAGITALVSLDDGQDVLSSVELITQRIRGIVLRQFTDKGHFTFEDMGTEEFPELLQIII